MRAIIIDVVEQPKATTNPTSRGNLAMKTFWCFLVLCTTSAFADTTDPEPNEKTGQPESGIMPDLRNDEMRLKLQKGDFVVVPIPISNPTLDTGLVAGGAYFYGQTPEQEKTQPASLTAVAAMYTSNDSKAFGIAQQNYWHQDTWRFSGALGYADLKLSLLAPDEAGNGQSINWAIRGNFLQAFMSRKILGNWYGSLGARFIDVEQSIEGDISTSDFDTAAETRSVAIGINLEYDNRDMPLNTYNGNIFQAKALFNDESFGSDRTYQSYTLAYRSYHEMSIPLVLAWEVEGCQRVGAAPLWDACSIGLRGFPITDYLGKFSASVQFEARWKMSPRWGVVGFIGGGYAGSTFAAVREDELIPSYGLGLRYMVLKSKRINLRLDYARSTDSDAIYVSVGEAF